VREQEERKSRLRVQAKCRQIMERYPNLRAQPTWVPKEGPAAQSMGAGGAPREGSWHVTVSQAT
jgi:hypothetical protein